MPDEQWQVNPRRRGGRTGIRARSFLVLGVMLLVSLGFLLVVVLGTSSGSERKSNLLRDQRGTGPANTHNGHPSGDACALLPASELPGFGLELAGTMIEREFVDHDVANIPGPPEENVCEYGLVGGGYDSGAGMTLSLRPQLERPGTPAHSRYTLSPNGPNGWRASIATGDGRADITLNGLTMSTTDRAERRKVEQIAERVSRDVERGALHRPPQRWRFGPPYRGFAGPCSIVPPQAQEAATGVPSSGRVNELMYPGENDQGEFEPIYYLPRTCTRYGAERGGDLVVNVNLYRTDAMARAHEPDCTHAELTVPLGDRAACVNRVNRVSYHHLNTHDAKRALFFWVGRAEVMIYAPAGADSAQAVRDRLLPSGRVIEHELRNQLRASG